MVNNLLHETRNDDSSHLAIAKLVYLLWDVFAVMKSDGIGTDDGNPIIYVFHNRSNLFPVALTDGRFKDGISDVVITDEIFVKVLVCPHSLILSPLFVAYWRVLATSSFPPRGEGHLRPCA